MSRTNNTRDGPFSLYGFCLEASIKNPNVLGMKIPVTDEYKKALPHFFDQFENYLMPSFSFDCHGVQYRYVFKEDLCLPGDIYQDLLLAHRKCYWPITDYFLQMLSDMGEFQLRNLDLSFVSRRNFFEIWQYLRSMMQHQPVEFRLPNCANLDISAVLWINQYSENLRVLSLGTNLIDENLYLRREQYYRFAEKYKFEKAIEAHGRFGSNFILSCPKLEFLQMALPGPKTLENAGLEPKQFMKALLTPLGDSLKHLVLDGFIFKECDKPGLSALKNLQNLESLSLYSFIFSEKDIEVIGCLHKLRHLDLTECCIKPEKNMEKKNSLLRNIFDQLPNLKSLDVSLSHLLYCEPTETCAIPILEGRNLEFLGLVKCDDIDARENIPATQVTGTANLEQMMLALDVYRNKPRCLIPPLKVLLVQMKDSWNEDVMNEKPVNKVIKLVTRLMGLDITDYSKTRTKVPLHLACKIIRHIQEHFPQGFKAEDHRTLVQLIGFHMTELMDYMDNAIMTEEFDALNILSMLAVMLVNTTPQEGWLIEYRRICTCMLRMVRFSDQNWYPRTGLFILKIYSSLSNKEQKEVIGSELQAMQVILDFIIMKNADLDFEDKNFVKAWSILWSLTDTADENCRLFMKIKTRQVDSLSLCLYVIYKCSTETDESLSNKVLGVLSNVSECVPINSILMDSRLLTKLYTILRRTDPDESKIELPYHCCSILLNLMVEYINTDAWPSDAPCPYHIQEAIVKTITQWPINISRAVRYRTFVPILNMLLRNDLPVVQAFGMWVISNFTFIKCARYMQMFLVEEGLPKVTKLLQSPDVPFFTKRLGENLLERVQGFKEQGAYFLALAPVMPALSEAQQTELLRNIPVSTCGDTCLHPPSNEGLLHELEALIKGPQQVPHQGGGDSVINDADQD